MKIILFETKIELFKMKNSLIEINTIKGIKIKQKTFLINLFKTLTNLYIARIRIVSPCQINMIAALFEFHHYIQKRANVALGSFI